MSTTLENVWKECTSNIAPSVADEWWTNIVKNYNEEGRCYHNLEHLEDKMSHYFAVRDLLHNPKAVALAIFFNYFEYDPKAMDCETRNVAAFEKFADESEIPFEDPIRIEGNILLKAAATHSTEEHKTGGAVGCEDRHYFLDIDMTPLGAPPEDYAKYSSRVRDEYSFLPDAMYRNLRLRVLQNFLQIPNIFATKEFRDKYEEAARNNISKEVETLKVLQSRKKTSCSS